MIRENNRSVNEKELFHGTRANDPAQIYEEGFDMRLSAGGKWGRANYFTVSAGYADRFAHRTADGCKEIFFLARWQQGTVAICSPTREFEGHQG